jgi:hypothetical protein
MHRRQHSNLPDVRSFRGVDCNTSHCLLIAEVRDRLAVSKLSTQKLGMERENLKETNKIDDKDYIRLTSQTGSQLWKTQMRMCVSSAVEERKNENIQNYDLPVVLNGCKIWPLVLREEHRL